MAERRERLDYSELALRLAKKVDQLVPVLLPGASCVSQFWRAGSFAGGAGVHGGSLAVNRSGRRQGMWCEFNGAPRPGKRYASGNLLQLINEVRFGGGNIVAAADWAARWLGDELNEATPKRPPPPAALDTRVDERPLRVWRAAKALRPGDPVWRYLDGRGINLDRLPYPVSLRYHPGLWHSPSQQTWPAMVAVIRDVAGVEIAIHRTWLQIIENWEPEEGLLSDVRKAPVVSPKMSWGRYTGGSIHLSLGVSGRPWGKMFPGETLMLGEGIEDTLSGVQHYPAFRAAAAVSGSAMLALELPEQITAVAILRQRDPPGSPADERWHRVMDRFVRQGRRVFEWQVPIHVKDINELDQRIALHCGGNDGRRGT